MSFANNDDANVTFPDVEEEEKARPPVVPGVHNPYAPVTILEHPQKKLAIKLETAARLISQFLDTEVGQQYEPYAAFTKQNGIHYRPNAMHTYRSGYGIDPLYRPAFPPLASENTPVKPEPKSDME